MSESPEGSPDFAYLLLRSSLAPDTTTRVDLSEPVTCLGRPEPQDVGPHSIDLKLENISRRHARIVRQERAYMLENWLGRGKIGLYERSLSPGERHELRHNDIFRIPDLEGPHVRLIFVVGYQTRFLPLTIEAGRPSIHVFGEEIRVRPQEHELLSHLYQHQGQICPYDTLIDLLWPPGVGGQRPPAVELKRQLDVLLSGLRNKIRPASGGFTFMETFPGEGLRLVF